MGGQSKARAYLPFLGNGNTTLSHRQTDRRPAGLLNTFILVGFCEWPPPDEFCLKAK
jgi:hypothetical protein